MDLSATSSQNGLIREDSSLAETFLLIATHNTKKCWALQKRFLKYCLPSFLHTSSWCHEATWAHVKLRQIYALPTVIILLLCILFLHSFSSLWIWPGGSYLCDQAAVNRAGWQTAEEPEMWNSISRTPQNTKMKLGRESWHILNSVDAQWMCNQVMLLYKPPCPSENVTFSSQYIYFL